MLISGSDYRPSMSRFLNRFSKNAQSHTPERNEYLQNLFASFLKASENCPPDTFVSSRTRRFSLALFEAVFTALCTDPFKNGTLVDRKISAEAVRQLDADTEFIEASEKASADKTNVDRRLRRARSILLSSSLSTL